jgi:hypothetical protein
MSDKTTSVCVNGELEAGDLVLSSPDSDYACLVGRVLGINKAGTPEHLEETNNEGDSVHVDFTDAEYTSSRAIEIEEMFSNLYGAPMLFNECSMSDVIMEPDMLIRITGLKGLQLSEILDSHEKASAFYSHTVEALRTDEKGEATTEKLYSPLKFFIRSDDTEEYDEMDYWRDEMSQSDAVHYKDTIELAIKRDIDYMDAERYMAEYLDDDEVGGKVISLFPSVELKGGRLWCIADIRLSGPLSQEEESELKDWWEGQLSDGWGEGFEQREIRVSGGELYVEPWDSGDGFFVDTENEFRTRLGLAPKGHDRELERKLCDNVNRGYEDFRKNFLDRSKDEVFEGAGIIKAMDDARFYLTEFAHELPPGEVEGLLKLENPIDVVACAWKAYMDNLSDMTAVIRKTAVKADSAEISGIARNERDTRVIDSFMPVPGKLSVLDQIRRDKARAKYSPAPSKNTPAKDHGPEL